MYFGPIKRSAMYRTPTLSTLFEHAAIALDIHERGSRKRTSSESKSFTTKQRAFSFLFSELCEELSISSTCKTHLENSLFKIENLLTELRTIPIYSDTPKKDAENIFFMTFTIPVIQKLTEQLVAVEKNVFFETVSHLVFSQQDKITVKSSQDKFKHCVHSLIKTYDLPKDLAKNIESELSKLDTKSFRKVSTIRKQTTDLENSLPFYKIENEALLSDYYLTWLAGRCAFLISREIEKKHVATVVIDDAIRKDTQKLCEDYICNPHINYYETSCKNNQHFLKCKKDFLNKIKVENPAKFLSVHGTRKLFEHKNGIFYTYAIWQQIWSDLDKRRLSKSDIEKYTKSIGLLQDRQAGSDAINIASTLIGLTVINKKTITPNTLNPLVSFFMEHLPTMGGTVPTVLELAPALSPFDTPSQDNLDSEEYNTNYAIRIFNQLVKENEIFYEKCNPLIPLEQKMKTFFSKGKLSAKDKRVRSIKTVPKSSLYDVLKNLDQHIINFGLECEITYPKGYTKVLKSYAGPSINKYLQLSNQEKLNILQKIDKKAFESDINTNTTSKT